MTTQFIMCVLFFINLHMLAIIHYFMSFCQKEMNFCVELSQYFYESFIILFYFILSLLLKHINWYNIEDII
ncbi:hypothetical protein EB796_004972 [Bugula neritina]|uniref:Uncharacterized protein n=1 Tax=Bugula neritina TaxID=10212 RepID=A0A7J7KDJ5_BUGNE|nr:hypothetical protein EB796_004972 [Bugula neritina]